MDSKNIRVWLMEGNSAPILEIAEKRKGVLSRLTAFTYDSDANICDRAIEVTGLAARIIARRDPEYIRNYLLRLFWLLNDESGGIGWRAPELIGEILYHCPQYGQFFPMLISLLDLEEEDALRFRAGTLWAIGRVAQVERNAMIQALPRVRNIIWSDENINTEVKRMAMWCEQQLIAES